MIAGVCIGTCLTQMILMGYFASRGTLNGGSVAQVIALMNGIDVSGDRLKTLFRENEEYEAPSYEEVLAARKVEGLDMDMRDASNRRAKLQMLAMGESLRLKEEYFDERVETLNQFLNDEQSGAKEAGIREQVAIMQDLEPALAKEMLMTDYDDERIDDVVNMVKVMSQEKQIEILSEFVTTAEKDALHEILRRIGQPALNSSIGEP